MVKKFKVLTAAVALVAVLSALLMTVFSGDDVVSEDADLMLSDSIFAGVARDDVFHAPVFNSSPFLNGAPVKSLLMVQRY